MTRILLTLALVGCALFATDAYQVQRAATLTLPVPVDPVRGNAEAEAILAHDPLTAADSARLCVIARGMPWDAIRPKLATFLGDVGCY